MSAHFIATSGILKGVILSLEEGDEWVIGKDPSLCQLIVEDPNVARKQLRCRLTDEGYLIESLSDEFPVMVNDSPLTEPTFLKPGDKLQLGASTFEFYIEATEAGEEGEVGFAFSDEAPLEEGEIYPTEMSEASGDEEPEEPPSEEAKEEPPPEPEEPPPYEEETPFEPPLGEEKAEEEEIEGRETIFEEEAFAELPDVKIDLTRETRFMIKVIAGPNTGAEFALDLDRSYLIGTDTISCDIVFNDLSVSREHARLHLSKDGKVSIEDLGSRNGVIVEKERIVGTKEIGPNNVVALGTSVFLFIDREAPSETITAPIFEIPAEEEKEEVEALEEEAVAAREEAPKEKPSARPLLSAGTLILALIIGGMAVLLGIGMVSLFQEKEIEVVHRDYLADIQAVMKEYPGVKFTYNKLSGKLFLMGHVSTGIQHNELLYKLRALSFIKGIEDNIVNDEAIWQEMNILLSKHPEFKGVSLHAPEPGLFVLSGYLKTDKQASSLIDYMNVNFNYLNLLQNRVVVEQQVTEEVASQLIQHGFGAVVTTFTNGELQLTGYVSATQRYEFDNLIKKFKEIPGVRSVRNFVVAVSPEQGVIDLNKRYPNRFRVTGFSKHGDVSINVVINGRILTRGDQLDGMTITSIQPHTIFLDKDGLKYKIEYNK